ncbi:MAG: AAA family ATPase [Acidobacteria bacterium]|nr:AAA family ATPase [Acidobacteriota bacterium]MBI3658341.1 AAA family ATPase [Acidobacteriota bacterium]
MQDRERTYVTNTGMVFRLEPQDKQASTQRDVVHNLFYVKRGQKKDLITLLVSIGISGFTLRLINRNDKDNDDTLYRVCVNRIREALDKSELDFEKPQEPSEVFQEIYVDSEWFAKYMDLVEANPEKEREIREFIAQKVYWLGYISGGMKGAVNLNDPIDWEYLRVEKEAFKRNAEFLQQEGWVTCSPQDPLSVQPTAKLITKLEQPPHRLYAEEISKVAEQPSAQVSKGYPPFKLRVVEIKGYKAFKDLRAPVGALEVLVGANGSGKSSLFEFLRFLRDGMNQDIPPEIVVGSVGQQVFHKPGLERFAWGIDIDISDPEPLRYEGTLNGPVGQIHIFYERVRTVPSDQGAYLIIMSITRGQGTAQEYKTAKYRDFVVKRSNQLALSTMTDSSMITLYNLREYISAWRFYSAFNIANDKIRRPVPIEQEPTLREDAGNLSSVLHYLWTEHSSIFVELQQHLSSAIPGFRRLTVKARGGPGEVMAFWQEEGMDTELSLADLSDGILRFICWAVLCVQPNPPSLICIDEPDQGVHPRTLPILAGLFEKAADRTQILLATHASYFLTQFDLSRIAVLRKENGEVKFIKPQDSKTLIENLKDFGPEEIEIMHRTDELEWLA